MSSSLKTLILFPLCLLLVAGCRLSQKPQEGRALLGARDATVYVTIVTRALTTLPHFTRPSASLGIHMSAYLSTGVSPVHGALQSAAILSTLVRTSNSTDAHFMTIQTLEDLVQTNIVEAMNQNPDRGEVLNRYTALLHSALQNAQKDKGNLEDSRNKLMEKEREQRNTLRTLRQNINAAEKAGDFRAMGFHQRALSEASGEQGKIKASIEELKNTLNILDDLTILAEERLYATEENREALMAGIRIVETPGIEKLGIIEAKGKFPRSPKRQKRNGGLLDFSDL